MNILLGIYHTSTFTERLKDTSLQTFPFHELLEDWDNLFHLGIIDLVAMACTRCDTIYFVLDEIKLPLNTKESVSCGELKQVLYSKKFFNKTIFILDNKELTNEEFDNWLNKE